MKKSLLSLSLGILLSFSAQATVSPNDQQQFAHAIYEGSAQWVHQRNPQPLLRAVVVMKTHMNADHVLVTDVYRTNDQQPEMLERAKETIQRIDVQKLSPSTRNALENEGILETWLFDSDGSFQVKTLAKKQQ